MSITDYNLNIYDAKNYPSTHGGYYVSSQSKMWFDADYTTSANYGVYRVRLTFPDSTSALYGYSRNLLSFTGNTSVIASSPGTYEWHKTTYSTAQSSVGMTSDHGTGESGGLRTKFNFGPMEVDTGYATFWQNVRTSMKSRHTKFRFTASVRGDANKRFSLVLMVFGKQVSTTITTTGNWQSINIPIDTGGRDGVAFNMTVTYTLGGVGSTATLEMIEPMLAVDESVSNVYTWCPNGLDNYRYYPKGETFRNTYVTESRYAHFDWGDSTHTPKVNATTTSYTVTFNTDCYTGTNATSETTEIDAFAHVAAYAPPIITPNSPTAYRTDDQGDYDDEGDYFAAEYDVTTYPVNPSSPMITYFRIGWRTYPSGSWQYDDVSAPWHVAGTTAHLTMFPGALIDPIYSWEVGLEYKDDFTDWSLLQYMPIPDSYALIDYHYTGRGISFGRVASSEAVERGGIDINMDVYFTSDIEWTELTLDSACEAYSVATTPHYRKRDTLVTIIGDVRPTAEVASGGTMSICTLPEAVRPQQRVSLLCQGSGRAAWLCTINTDGTMSASRYHTEAGNQAMTTSSWLPFAITYLL